MTEETLAQGISHWHLGYNTTIFIYLVYSCCYFQLHPLQKSRLRWLEIIDSNLQSLYPTMHRLWL